MYGVLSFQTDEFEASTVRAVRAAPDQEPEVLVLDESNKVSEEPPGASPHEVGLVHTGVVDRDMETVELLCVFRDDATGSWWTREAGEVPIDDVMPSV